VLRVLIRSIVWPILSLLCNLFFPQQDPSGRRRVPRDRPPRLKSDSKGARHTLPLLPLLGRVALLLLPSGRLQACAAATVKARRILGVLAVTTQIVRRVVNAAATAAANSTVSSAGGC